MKDINRGEGTLALSSFGCEQCGLALCVYIHPKQAAQTLDSRAVDMIEYSLSWPRVKINVDKI